MRNIIDELTVKHDMFSVIQGVNHFMLNHTLALDSMNLQKALTPDDNLLGNYICIGLCCLAIHTSLKDYRSRMSEENLTAFGKEYDMIMKRSNDLVGYMLIKRAKFNINTKIDLISINQIDGGVTIAADEALMDEYARVIIDYIDNALNSCDTHSLTEQIKSMTKEYNMICELSNQMEKKS